MRHKRYEFYRAVSGAWALVFDAGRWHIERTALGKQPVRISIPDFESSEHGRALSDQLARAVHAAETDL